jgi:peptidoglycan/xylan/chitin deacetylase (PgdA/CDA1 family)
MVMSLEERVVYSAIGDRPKFTWPGGAGLAVWFAVNTEHIEFMPPSGRASRVPDPDLLSFAPRSYGVRVAFWRLLGLLDSIGLPVTASLNIGILEYIPEVRDAMVERNWAIMSHGIFNSRNIIGMSEEQEREFFAYSTETVKKYTGRDLRGMLTPGISANYWTPDLMAEAGMTYHVDWVNDDQPVPLRVENGNKFITIPYTFELNTGALFGRHFDAAYYEETAKAQFATLLRDAASAPRIMTISVHPYAIANPQNLGYLESLLRHLREADGVWWTTGDDIAEYYLEHAYDAEVAYEASLTRGR